MENLTTSNESNQFESSFENIQPAKPNNNLVLAIVGTVIGLCSPCCFPGLILGIVAIVMSTQVDSKYNAGDYPGAEKAAKNAKILAFVALGLGIIGLIWSIISIATGASNAMTEQYLDILRSQGYDL